MNSTARIAVAAAVVAVVAAIGYMLIPSSNIGDDQTPSASPSSSAAADIRLLPSAGRFMEAGRYFISGPYERDGQIARGRWGRFPVDVTVRVPQGWTSGSPFTGSVGIERSLEADGAGGIGPRMHLNLWMVNNVIADGCSSTGIAPAEVDPPIGPTVDDLVAALTSIPEVVATPADVALDGWDGTRVDLTTREDLTDCEFVRLWNWQGTGVGPEGDLWSMSTALGAHHQLWILDVDGLRLVVDASYLDGTSTELQAELQEIVASIDIEPRR